MKESSGNQKCIDEVEMECSLRGDNMGFVTKQSPQWNQRLGENPKRYLKLCWEQHQDEEWDENPRVEYEESGNQDRRRN